MPLTPNRIQAPDSELAERRALDAVKGCVTLQIAAGLQYRVYLASNAPHRRPVWYLHGERGYLWRIVTVWQPWASEQI